MHPSLVSSSIFPLVFANFISEEWHVIVLIYLWLLVALDIFIYLQAMYIFVSEFHILCPLFYWGIFSFICKCYLHNQDIDPNRFMCYKHMAFSFLWFFLYSILSLYDMKVVNVFQVNAINHISQVNNLKQRKNSRWLIFNMNYLTQNPYSFHSACQLTSAHLATQYVSMFGSW